jgi:hypothetical protein
MEVDWNKDSKIDLETKKERSNPYSTRTFFKLSSGGVCDNVSRAHHLIHAWPATAHVGTSTFVINVGAEAQMLSRQSAPALMALRSAAASQCKR